MTTVEPERELFAGCSRSSLSPSSSRSRSEGPRRSGRGLVRSHRVAVVAGNFLAFALSIAWAAKVSPTLLALVALGGYLVRLVIFTLVLVGLNTLAWFSPLAFALALMPATIGLLVYEAKLLSGRLQAEMWIFGGDAAVIGLVAAVFEPPSTKDFVFGCWGPSYHALRLHLCFNFILVPVVLTTIIVLTLFYLGVPQARGRPGQAPDA